MFGYILPEKPELKIREYELFRAYYCGVCKSIAKRHGQLHRMVLNYDSTFLAVLLSSLAGEKIAVKKQNCIAHPLKKRLIALNSGIIDYASDINIILAYYNLEDNWKDDRSVVSGSIMFLLHNAFKKLKKQYKEKCVIIEKYLNELHELEKNGCSSMDAAAEPFAKLMEAITAYEPLCTDENREKILKWVGYNIGKWVYILDAFDDLEKDLKKKSYNPLLCQYDSSKEEISQFKERIKERVEFNLTHSLSQIAKAYELLGINRNTGLLENIIYMGMLRKTEQILKTRSCENIEESI